MKRNIDPVAGQTYLIALKRFSLKESILVAAYFFLLFSLLHLQYDEIRLWVFLYPVI